MQDEQLFYQNSSRIGNMDHSDLSVCSWMLRIVVVFINSFYLFIFIIFAGSFMVFLNIMIVLKRFQKKHESKLLRLEWLQIWPARMEQFLFLNPEFTINGREQNIYIYKKNLFKGGMSHQFGGKRSEHSSRIRNREQDHKQSRLPLARSLELREVCHTSIKPEIRWTNATTNSVFMEFMAYAINKMTWWRQYRIVHGARPLNYYQNWWQWGV